jgi:hypothetical protein
LLHADGCRRISRIRRWTSPPVRRGSTRSERLEPGRIMGRADALRTHPE